MKTLVVIVGPTASGKTESAITLAKALNTEILSCDSRQFYKELNIGVARPTPEELSAVPHHFIANRSVTHPYNAYQYEHEALDLLKSLFTKNDTMIAVGGSGLYIDALCTGINYLPCFTVFTGTELVRLEGGPPGTYFRETCSRRKEVEVIIR